MLRSYQENLIADLRAAVARGARAPLAVAPTGSGKTSVIAEICRRGAERGSRAIVLAHREEILRQISERLTSVGVDHGVIAPRWRATDAAIQVASAQTLVRRLDRTPSPDVLITDEAHHAAAGTWRRIADTLAPRSHLGFTATPCRLDGKPLNSVFDTLVEGPSVPSLIAGGWLVDARVYAPSMPDLTGVRTRGGDYAAGDLDERMRGADVVGDVVDHYRRIAPGTRAVAFCVSVAHAHAVADAFAEAGIPAATLHGKLSRDERRQLLDAFARGDVHVLTSCDIVSEGFDLPEIETAILLRPTKSLGLYLQHVGRALRPAPGKTHAIVLDHAGAVFRHGWPTETRCWSLEEGAKPDQQRRQNDESTYQVRRCPECFHVHPPSPACPTCGYEYSGSERLPEEAEGILEELRPPRPRVAPLTDDEKRRRDEERRAACRSDDPILSLIEWRRRWDERLGREHDHEQAKRAAHTAYTKYWEARRGHAPKPPQSRKPILDQISQNRSI